MFHQPPAHPAATRLHPLFLGPEGLRAGWSLLLFATPIALLYTGILLLQHYVPDASRQAAQSQLTIATALTSELLVLALILGCALLVSRVEASLSDTGDRPFSRFGLASAHRLADLTRGLFWGLICLSLLVAALRLTHHIAFDGIALRGPAILAYALGWAATFLAVGLMEEFLFRGFLQYTAARGISGLTRALFPNSRHTHAIGFWSATLLFSVGLFALIHTANAGESPLGIAAVAAAGLTFAFSLWRTGTLWWAIGFHAAWDWAMSYLYGVADSGGMVQGHLLASHPIGRALYSGGTTGPEGSILVFPTLILAALVIHLTLPRRPYPLTPAQQPPPFTLTQDADPE